MHSVYSLFNTLLNAIRWSGVVLDFFYINTLHNDNDGF